MPQRVCSAREVFPISLLSLAVRLVKGALSRRHTVTVQLTDTVEATIYDRPGEWMTDAQLSTLREEVRAVARSAVAGELDYGVFRADRAPYENRLLVVGRHKLHGEAVGFNAMPQLDVPLGRKRVRVLHLGLLVIHKRYQRQGLQGLLYGLGAFSALHRIRDRPVWMSNVTEVPAVFGAVADNFVDVYPSYKRAGPPPELHQRIARGIMERHRHEFGVGKDAGFDEARFVIEGSYTGGSDALKKTFADAPKYRLEEVNDFCARQLDYGRGDDFLQVGQLDLSVISNWLSRRIPEGFRPQATRQMKLWRYPSQGLQAGGPT